MVKFLLLKSRSLYRKQSVAKYINYYQVLVISFLKLSFVTISCRHPHFVTQTVYLKQRIFSSQIKKLHQKIKMLSFKQKQFIPMRDVKVFKLSPWILQGGIY